MYNENTYLKYIMYNGTQIQLNEKTVNNIKNVVNHFDFGVKGVSVFLFGSRITQNAKSKSDIDIGLISTQKIDSEYLQDFKEKLDNLPIFYKFDVVDFSKTSEQFCHNALKHTYQLN